MADLNGHEAGNGGHSQGKPTAYRDSSTRRDGDFSTVIKTEDAKSLRLRRMQGTRFLHGC